MKILVIDRFIESARAVAFLLADESYEVQICDTYEAAISLLFQNEYDLVITGWVIPNGHSGLEIANRCFDYGIDVLVYTGAASVTEDRIGHPVLQKGGNGKDLILAIKKIYSEA